MTRSLLALSFLLCFSLSCAEATEIIVEVRSDVPLERLTIEYARGSEEGRTRVDLDIYELPVTQGFQYEGGERQVTLKVIGHFQNENRQIIERTVEFIDGESRREVFTIRETCGGVSCPDGVECIDGQCGDAERSCPPMDQSCGVCPSGCNCSFVANDREGCAITCQEGSTCNIECTGESECMIRIEAGATAESIACRNASCEVSVRGRVERATSIAPGTTTWEVRGEGHVQSLDCTEHRESCNGAAFDNSYAKVVCRGCRWDHYDSARLAVDCGFYDCIGSCSSGVRCLPLRQVCGMSCQEAGW